MGIHAKGRFGGPLLNKQHSLVEWCSWLSRQSNTLKVSGSNPGLIILNFAQSAASIFAYCYFLRWIFCLGRTSSDILVAAPKSRNAPPAANHQRRCIHPTPNLNIVHVQPKAPSPFPPPLTSHHLSPNQQGHKTQTSPRNPTLSLVPTAAPPAKARPHTAQPNDSSPNE